jgi:hypothetical protein
MIGNGSFTLNRAHSNAPSTPQTPYNPFHSLSQLWSYPSSDSPKRKFLQEESLPIKRRTLEIEKKERKGARKRKRGETSYANTRAWKAPWKKERSEWELQDNWWRGILKRKWKWRSHFPIVTKWQKLEKKKRR